MGGVHQKVGKSERVKPRYVHLLALFFCAALLFLLVAFWRINGESGNLYQSIDQLLSSQGALAPAIGASNLQNGTVKLDKLDPSVWQTILQDFSLSSTNNQATTTSLTGLYVRPTDQPHAGDISGTFDSGLTVNADAVTLGTDTTGIYVASVTGGQGLQANGSGENAAVALDIKAGNGIAVGSDGVAVNVRSDGGLTLEGGSLALLNSCADNQLLKWDTSSSAWLCGADNAGAGSLTVAFSDGSTSVSPTAQLEFGPASASSDEFIITDQGGAVARIRTGSAVPLTNSTATITGGWTYDSQIAANGGLSCADCIALGSETTGSYLADLLAGGGLAVSGSGGEGASPTVSLDTASANTWSALQTFGSGLAVGGNTYTNLAGTGLSFSSGTLSATLGTSIDSTEIVDGTITAADIADGTLTLAKIGQNACTTNQIIKWNGSAWACAADTDTNTTYSAGSGLALTGTTFSLDSSLAMFKTIDASLGTDPIADSLTDTLTLSSGNGVNVTGDATADSVSFSLNLASGSGLTVSSGALTLLNTCSDGQYLAWTSGTSSWDCASLTSAPNNFQTVAGDSGSAVTDSPSDTLTLVGGNGLTSTGSNVSDTVTFDIDLASGSGLAFSSGALTLQSCTDGQILKRVAGAWTCSADTFLGAAAYKQQLSGTDNVAVASSLTPLLTNGSGTAQSLGITISSSNEVSFNATVQVSSSLVAGPVNYVVIRDDNHDNDCATGGGDGTQIGAQVTSFIASVAQSFTTTLAFSDTSPAAGTNYYQLCASTSIATGTTTVTNRALKLDETNL